MKPLRPDHFHSKVINFVHFPWKSIHVVDLVADSMVIVVHVPSVVGLVAWQFHQTLLRF